MIKMLLVIDSTVLDRDIETLRNIQKVMGHTPLSRLIGEVINDLSRESVSVTMSIERGRQSIIEEM